MLALRLVGAIFSLGGLGLHIWLLVKLWQWARLPVRYTEPGAPWGGAALWSAGGLFTGGFGVVAVALPLPGFTAHPWEYLPNTLWPFGFAWLLRSAVREELLYLRAHKATRKLQSTAERLVRHHGGDAEPVRELTEMILSRPVPDEAATPWHKMAWLGALRDRVPYEFLTEAEHAELTRAVSRYHKAVGRFDVGRRYMRI
jgi:hypothetical protein